MSPAPRLRDLPDDALVTAARDGDAAAMGELLSRHYDRIHAVCCRIAGDTRDGEDATQETLLRIVRNLHSFDQRAKFSTWIYRIATNAALDEVRRRQRRPIAVDPSPPGASEDHAPGLSGHIDPLSSEEIDRIADQMVIQDAIASLSESHRAVVVLRDVAGLDYSEIAAALVIPEGTVKSRLARARAELILKIRNSGGIAERPKDTND